MYIPPKAGRLGSGAYHDRSPIHGDPFGRPPSQSGPLEGGLTMPEDRTTTIFAHPFTGQRSTAKQETIGPKVNFYNTEVDVHLAPSIQPHERGTFFATHQPVLARTKFGAAKTEVADTPFHRNPRPSLPRPVPRSAIDTGHIFAVSFHSQGNMWGDKNNSFVQGRTTPANPTNIGRGRWNMVKKGAV